MSYNYPQSDLAVSQEEIAMKVVAFNGSPHKKGNTSVLINVVLDELKNEGIATELVQIGVRPFMVAGLASSALGT